MADQPYHDESLKLYEEADEFTRAFIECALWLADPTPSSGEYSAPEEDIAAIYPDSMREMIKDCADFQEAHAALLAEAYGQKHRNGRDYDEASAGHDFFLTRVGHGAGFWDRGLGDLGDKLTEASKVFGGEGLYCEQGDETDYDPEAPRAFYWM